MEEQQVQCPIEEDITLTQQDCPQASSKIKFTKRTWTLIAIICAAAILLAIVVGSIVSAFSPESVAEKYVEAYMHQDICKLQKYVAYDSYEQMLLLSDGDEEAFFEEISDYFDEDISSWKELSRVARKYREEDLQDEYGKYKITIEATRTKDISVRKLEEENEYLLDELEENGLFDRDDISGAKEITVKVKIAGEDEIERETMTVYLVKCGISWKVLTVE